MGRKRQLATCLFKFRKNIKLPFLFCIGSSLYKNRVTRSFLLHLRKQKWFQLSSWKGLQTFPKRKKDKKFLFSSECEKKCNKEMNVEADVAHTVTKNAISSKLVAVTSHLSVTQRSGFSLSGMYLWIYYKDWYINKKSRAKAFKRD